MIDLISELARDWAHPDYGPRRRFTNELRASGIFSPGSLEVGLTQTFEALNESVLCGVVSRFEKFPSSTNRNCVFIPAGNLPITGVFDFFAGILAGQNCTHRLSRRGGKLLEYLAKDLIDRDPSARVKLSVVQSDSSSDVETRTLLKDAHMIVAQGNEETLHHLSLLAPTTSRFYARPPSISAAFIRPEKFTPKEARDLMSDVFIWEQAGCLSPQILFVESQTPSSVETVISRLHDAASLLAQEWKRQTFARIVGMIRWIELEHEVAFQSAYSFSRSDHLAVAHVPQFMSHWISTPGFVQAVTVEDITVLTEPSIPISSVATHESEISKVSEAIGLRWPHARVTSFGRLQAPPFDWNQDGLDRTKILMSG